MFTERHTHVVLLWMDHDQDECDDVKMSCRGIENESIRGNSLNDMTCHFS